MAKKGKREVIILESTAAGSSYRYTTHKNRSNTPDRLEIKKYDPTTKKHEIFKEKK